MKGSLQMKCIISYLKDVSCKAKSALIKKIKSINKQNLSSVKTKEYSSYFLFDVNRM